MPHINQEKPALRLTSPILFILVLPFTLLHQTKQLLKRLHPLRPHLPCIQRLPICLHPIQHIMLLNPMSRWVTMVGFNKLNHLLVPCQPSRSLIHTSDILHQTSTFYAPLRRHRETQNLLHQPSAIKHQPSIIFPLTSYIVQHISLQPSYISHLSSSFFHRPSIGKHNSHRNHSATHLYKR